MRRVSQPPKPTAKPAKPEPQKGPIAPWVTNIFNGNSIYEIEGTHIPLRLGGTWYVYVCAVWQEIGP